MRSAHRAGAPGSPHKAGVGCVPGYSEQLSLWEQAAKPCKRDSAIVRNGAIDLGGVGLVVVKRGLGPPNGPRSEMDRPSRSAQALSLSKVSSDNRGVTTLDMCSFLILAIASAANVYNRFG